VDRNDDGAVESDRADIDPLRYQPRSEPQPVRRPAAQSTQSSAFAGELLTVKARYKLPEGDRSDLLSVPVKSTGRAQHLPFASAVAEFGLLLRDSPNNSQRWAALERRVGQLSVPAAQASDKEGFSELVSIAAGLARIR
jgi:hypothetical protein